MLGLSRRFYLFQNISFFNSMHINSPRQACLPVGRGDIFIEYNYTNKEPHPVGMR